jgi:type I restriction enzyme S subunit
MTLRPSLARILGESKMWINRVPPSLLETRVDSEYYAPLVFEKLSKLMKFNPLPMNKFVEDIRSEPPIHTDHYFDNGIHIISPANFTDFEIDFNKTNKLNNTHRDLFVDFILKPGRILFALVGDVGHAVVVPNNVPESISYRRTANILLSKIDVYFVCAFINSSFGNVQLKRLTTGVIQAQVRLEDSAEILIPSLDHTAQRYIGDKVRQAEKLRVTSKQLITSAKLLVEVLIEGLIKEAELVTAQQFLEKGDYTVDQELLSQLDQKQRRGLQHRHGRSGGIKMWINRIPPSLLESRIDSDYYSPSVFEKLKQLNTWNLQPISKFVEDLRSEPPIHTDHYSESGLHIISPANFTDFELDLSKTNKLNNRYKELFRDFLLQPGRLLYSLVGDVGHACVVPNPAPEAISYRRTANLLLSNIDTHFVCSFLNSSFGVTQIKRLTTGVIQDQVRLEDSVGILLPSIDSAAQRYIGDKVRKAEKFHVASEQLTSGAKILVEVLIEGQVSEAELVMAQQALEKGDRTTDRELLSRITRKGMNIPGEPPLFPDLDALYKAIDEVNKPLPTVGATL